MKNKNSKIKKNVLITTKYRGVFFGKINASRKDTQKKIKCYECQNVLSWSIEMNGFIGLATFGPTNKCRLGAIASKKCTLYGITSVIELSDKAIEALNKYNEEHSDTTMLADKSTS